MNNKPLTLWFIRSVITGDLYGEDPKDAEVPPVVFFNRERAKATLFDLNFERYEIVEVSETFL